MADQEKIIDKIKKIMSLAESEESLGNLDAAETIGAKAQEMLLKYKLSHKDIAVIQVEEPNYIPPIMGKSVVINPFVRINARTNKRMSWFEELAKTVAEGYFCKAAVEKDDVVFFGLDMDREVAIYMFLKIAERAKRICEVEIEKARGIIGMKRVAFGSKSNGNLEDIPKVWLGDEVFTDSFHAGFREAIIESYEETLDKNDPVIIKAKQEVEEYYLKNKPYSYYPTWNVIEIDGNISGWEFAINIGRKYGGRVSRKISSVSQSSSNGSLVNTKKKATLGDVYALLDDSGSMQGESIQQLKSGIKEFASDAIARGFRVGLIKFGHEITHLLTPQLEVDRRFIMTVEKLDARGHSTDMAGALRMSQAHFRMARGKKTVLLVTDGIPDDRNDTIMAANELKRAGIEIMTIGCGNADEELLKILASRGDLGELVDGKDLGRKLKGMAGLLTA